MPTTEQLDTSTKEIITRRKIRRRQVVAEVIKGKLTYEEIGRKHYPNANNPRQTVYSALQQPGTQAEIQRQIVDTDIGPDYLKGKLKAAIEATKPSQANHLRGLELGMRANAMLTDRNINDNRNTDMTDMVKLAEEAIKSIMGQTPDTVGEGQGIDNQEVKAE